MNIETYSQMKALLQASTEGNQRLVERLLEGEQADEACAQLKFKRIQFDSHAGLTEQLEEVCNLLDCTKREFLEMAVYEAVHRARETFFKTYQNETGCEYGTRVGYDSEGNEVEVTK